MKKRQWHSGPPPSVGWWPASKCDDPEIVRWWDGNAWSFAVGVLFSARMAAYYAEKIAAGQEEVKWTERWWE